MENGESDPPRACPPRLPWGGPPALHIRAVTLIPGHRGKSPKSPGDSRGE